MLDSKRKQSPESRIGIALLAHVTEPLDVCQPSVFLPDDRQLFRRHRRAMHAQRMKIERVDKVEVTDLDDVPVTIWKRNGPVDDRSVTLDRPRSTACSLSCALAC